jgi:hypothetical protein
MPDLGLGGHGPDEPLEQIESCAKLRKLTGTEPIEAADPGIRDRRRLAAGKVARYLSG